MGLNFRKSFKIAPGVRLNVGKKGISSLSVGGKGARVSIGKKGTTTSVGIPGSGLSYSSHTPYAKKQSKQTQVTETNNFTNQIRSISPSENQGDRKVSIILLVGILFIPYIFSWFTLRDGYSVPTRVISIGWMVLILIIMLSGK